MARRTSKFQRKRKNLLKLWRKHKNHLVRVLDIALDIAFLALLWVQPIYRRRVDRLVFERREEKAESIESDQSSENGQVTQTQATNDGGHGKPPLLLRFLRFLRQLVPFAGR